MCTFEKVLVLLLVVDADYTWNKYLHVHNRDAMLTKHVYNIYIYTITNT